ncbi:MAG: HAD-IIIA family hydrolase [Methanobacteriota archaeon]
MGRPPRRSFVYAETDGQVYLVRDVGVLRFPRGDEKLPFRTKPVGSMDFGDVRVRKVTPVLDRHPEEWLGRDAIFDREDVDHVVKRAIYTTMIRCVSEVVVSKGSRVLMVKAKRGFSKGHWNVPGGFMDYGEGPEAGARREAEEELGVHVVLEGLLNTYVTGFPGKPSYTLGFVYRGRVTSERFRLKRDEIESAAWFSVDRGLGLTRNPFAKWALVDFFLRSPEARRALVVKRHGLARRTKPVVRPTVFLDRDGVVNRGRPGYVRTPERFEFLPGAVEGMRTLEEAGWRLVLVTNQDVMGWKLISDVQLRRIHDGMIEALQDGGVHVAEIYYCPHRLGADCACRKPRPGMLLAAARDLGVSPRTAWMVGDKVLDVETGRAFGCRVAWVGPKAWRARFEREVRPWRPDVVADGLRGAAGAIARRPRTEPTSAREAKV